ncbi:hypothetical protein NA57DRAFT_60780 [Rhizodiscina lignyota]|uniref:Uncharacterized protein n=1 Tax=Rhizodiscina lignyota TaxID=1504668 RepID=A0A9P4I9B8_9PEZI|nr:hypothetical protein NA57DRAFT_60780 [Rhizodiscina lignyota]
MAAEMSGMSPQPRVERSALWNTYRNKGIMLWNNLITELSSALHQDRPTTDLSVFNNKVSEYHIAPTGEPLYFWEIDSCEHDPAADETDEDGGPFRAQFHNKYDMMDGVIGTCWNRRCYFDDEVHPDDDEATRKSNLERWCPYNWSQVVWAQWIMACNSSNDRLTESQVAFHPSSLRRVVRVAINNPITEALINEAIAPYVQGAPLGLQLSFRPENEEFLVLLASPHGNGMARLCMENRDALGGKSVQLITIGTGSTFSMVLEIE